MLFPLKDHNPSRTFPVITVGLIAINTAIFLLQTTNPAITAQYAMIPAEITGSQQAVLEAIRAAGPFALQRMDPQVLQRLFETGPAVPVHMTPFSSMFLHGSWLHLLANMWSLWIFGNNVEDALGKLRYLLIYLIWGFFAGWSHVLFNWTSPIPTVGASGAIAGVMGAYLLLFPGARLDCMLFYIIIAFVEVPAIFFLLFWLASQFLVYSPGVAYLAHIGGFVAGMITIKLMGGRQKVLGARAYEHEDW